MPQLAGFLGEHPGIDLRISTSTHYATFENDDFDLDIVYGEPQRTEHERLPLRIEELTPLCSPALDSRLNSRRACAHRP
ncbi:hypothetical protein [Pseudomonas fulva]|nr:hypothetical protein [Pseudomonas fulva]